MTNITEMKAIDVEIGTDKRNTVTAVMMLLLTRMSGVMEGCF